MSYEIRTDLASELINNKKRLPYGIEHETLKTSDGFNVERIFVDKRGEKELGKPAGTYITIDCGQIAYIDNCFQTKLSALISEEIKSLAFDITAKKINSDLKVLVVGLGNINMTPDAIGPQAVSLISATRKLAEEDPQLFENLECASVSSIAPGTSGQTGIETYEFVKCAVDHIKPDIVVAIDALAARSSARLGTTVQISSSGIHPGSGVGNRRRGLNDSNLGVPVMAIGVPTVVDSSTIIKDIISQFGVEQIVSDMDKLVDAHKSFLVSPSNCDSIVAHSSKILASAIDSAFGINL